MFQYKGCVWLYRQPIDFRKQSNSLVLLLADELEQNPTDGSVFVFRNKKSDRIKLLVYDKNGFWLLYKVLEKGRFQFPGPKEVSMTISPQQLDWLLSGFDITTRSVPDRVLASAFY